MFLSCVQDSEETVVCRNEFQLYKTVCDIHTNQSMRRTVLCQQMTRAQLFKAVLA